MSKLIIKNLEEWQVLVQWISQEVNLLSGCMFADELSGCWHTIKLAGLMLDQLAEIAKSTSYWDGSDLLLVDDDLLKHAEFRTNPVNPHMPHGDCNVLTQSKTVEYVENHADFLARVKAAFNA